MSGETGQPTLYAGGSQGFSEMPQGQTLLYGGTGGAQSNSVGQQPYGQRGSTYGVGGTPSGLSGLATANRSSGLARFGASAGLYQPAAYTPQRYSPQAYTRPSLVNPGGGSASPPGAVGGNGSTGGGEGTGYSSQANPTAAGIAANAVGAMFGIPGFGSMAANAAAQANANTASDQAEAQGMMGYAPGTPSSEGFGTVGTTGDPMGDANGFGLGDSGDGSEGDSGAGGGGGGK